jgi:hypothetical protein
MLFLFFYVVFEGIGFLKALEWRQQSLVWAYEKMLHNLVSLVVVLKCLINDYFLIKFNEETNVLNFFEFVRKRNDAW